MASEAMAAGKSGAEPVKSKGGAGKKYFLIGLLAILFAFPATVLLRSNMNYWLHLFLFTFMYIAMASSWNIIGGYAGYVSLGHNVFFAVGAYFSGILLSQMGISPFLTAPVAGVLASAIGFLVGLIALRTRGSAFIIATIALVLLTGFFFDKFELAGGANGLSLPLTGLPNNIVKIPFYYAFLILAILAVLLSYRVRNSKFGLGLRAISQDEYKAEVAGIPTNWYKITAFALSGLFVGMAGAFWGYYLTYLRPSLFLTIAIAAQMVLMCILGGKGTIAGPVVGAVLLIAVNEFFVTNLGSSSLNIVATGGLMLLVLLFFPAGIIGTLKERNLLPAFIDWE